MAQRSVGRVAAGAAIAVVGMVGATAGIARAPPLPSTILSVPSGPLFAVSGLVLVLSGTLFAFFFSIKRGPDPAPAVPAHVAFATKMQTALPEPARPPPPAPLVRHPEVARAPRTPVQLSADEIALYRVEEEIRELTRRINKAGVMLATGRISQQGYTHYVEDLKKQRGELEATRVNLEFRGV